MEHPDLRGTLSQFDCDLSAPVCRGIVHDHNFQRQSTVAELKNLFDTSAQGCFFVVTRDDNGKRDSVFRHLFVVLLREMASSVQGR
jgi:hypothetical protein